MKSLYVYVVSLNRELMLPMIYFNLNQTKGKKHPSRALALNNGRCKATWDIRPGNTESTSQI